MISRVLVFTLAVGMWAQQPAEQWLSAYRDMIQVVLVEHKSLDPEVIGRILKDLKSHFREHPDAFRNAGDFYFRLGQSDQAIREYEEGIATDVQHKVDYQKRKIEVLIRQGKTDQARELDLEMLKENPQDPEARGLEASFRLDKRDVDGAIAELEAVIPSLPGSFVARFNLGRAYFLRGEMEKARQRFEEAVALKADYMPSHQALIQLALKLANYEGALKYARAAEKIDPKNGTVILLESDALIHLNRFNEARGLLDNVLKANPSHADTLNELAVLDLYEKRYPEAEALFEKCYRIAPSNLRGLQGMIQVRLLQNQPEKAVQLAADEAGKQPDRADLRRLLAQTEFAAHQNDKAIADFQFVLDQYKDAPAERAAIFHSLGEAYGAKGDFAAGLESLKMARELAPANLLYASALAQMYDRSGRKQESAATYREALKINPNDPYVLNNLAFLIIETGGDLDEALALAQRSKQQLPSFHEVSDTIGWIYVKKKQGDRAVEVFRELVQKVPGNATFHYHYAVALVQTGDKAGARAELNLALQNRPGAQDEKDIRDLMRSLS